VQRVRGLAANATAGSSHPKTAKHFTENSIPDVWNEVEPPSPHFMDNVPSFTNSFLLSSSGWLQGGAEPLLWLPVERRGDMVASFKRRVFVGGKTGAVTILELPGEQGYLLSLLYEGRCR
jgi:hypothetical protein